MTTLITTDRGSGPPIVLLHGFPLDRTLWEAQVEALASEYRVLAPDLRGHGETPPAGDDYSMEAQAADVLDLLADRGIDGPFVLGGLSMGGYIALALASRVPDRITRLLLIATRAAADTPEAAANRLRLAAEVERSGDITPVVDAFLPRVLGATSQAERPELVERTRRMMLRTSPAAVAGCLRGMVARPDRVALLPQLPMPTLVLAGAEDPIASPDEGQHMAAALPRGRLVVVPKAGHLLPIEQPEVTSRVIGEFLAS
ncbi:MAG: alpha/beta hydrolase [Isosphaeraceae bacterium]|jgi:pimeloyl-ACP methyl ester carboxylesterase|nr:MAG: alpha/beta hydrolase [Isosphaeraceae bacterium]